MTNTRGLYIPRVELFINSHISKQTSHHGTSMPSHSSNGPNTERSVPGTRIFDCSSSLPSALLPCSTSTHQLLRSHCASSLASLPSTSSPPSGAGSPASAKIGFPSLSSSGGTKYHLSSFHSWAAVAVEVGPRSRRWKCGSLGSEMPNSRIVECGIGGSDGGGLAMLGASGWGMALVGCGLLGMSATHGAAVLRGNHDGLRMGGDMERRWRIYMYAQLML